jgi:hypothetical protein
VSDEARETRANYLEWKHSGNKTKTSNAAIQDAAYQVSLAKQAVVYEDDDIWRRMGNSSSAAQLPCHKKLYCPAIVTTARLFVCEFDPREVDPTCGEIVPVKASIAECDEVVFEYTLPRHLQFKPSDVAGSCKEGVVDLFTRLHILVVQSRRFPAFLQTFYGQGEAIPTDVPSPVPTNGPEDAQLGTARDTPP